MQTDGGDDGGDLTRQQTVLGSTSTDVGEQVRDEEVDGGGVEQLRHLDD